MDKCYYPDYEEGGVIVDKHIFDKDGCCIICGEIKEMDDAFKDGRLLNEHTPRKKEKTNGT